VTGREEEPLAECGGRLRETEIFATVTDMEESSMSSSLLLLLLLLFDTEEAAAAVGRSSWCEKFDD
jgi:hypothetical protein